MAYKYYTRTALADFTGRPLASFPQTYVDNTAIPQAVLLSSCLPMSRSW